MTLVTYNVPITISAQNNNTSITKTTFIVKDCGGFSDPNENCDGWNFNRCPNDEQYCQPFIKGDKIYLQLKFDQNKYTISSIQVFNTATGLNFYGSSFATLQTGRDALNNFYFNYILDTSKSAFDNIKCWYVKVVLTPKQGGDTVYYTSEPYCLVEECQDNTLLITGSYPGGYDCDGNYYGSLTGGFLPGLTIYIPSFRVRGVVEPDEFDMEKTISGTGKTIKSKQTERFILAMQKVPYYVARQIAVCFNSKQAKIDGVEYSGTIKLSKNFDEGSMWIIRENILRECEEINFTCE